MQHLIPASAADLTAEQIAGHYAWPDTETHPAPWVRMNFATSVDGAVAGTDGRSHSVSSPADKDVFALLRATCDAVIVGAGTARIEGYGPVRVRSAFEPIRAAQGRSRPPRLVVVTRGAELDPTADMFTGAISRTIVITGDGAPADRLAVLREVADVVQVAGDSVEPGAMVRALADFGLHRLLCEGGPHLFQDLLAAKQAHDLCWTVSPVLVGGLVRQPVGTVNNPPRLTAGAPPLPAELRLQLATVLREGDSLMTRYLIGYQ